MKDSGRASPAVDSAAVLPALEILRNANAAMRNAPDSLPGAPLSIEAVVESAREVYASACTPSNTLLITEAIEHILGDPSRQNDPELWAFLAHVRCCDYLNRWNGAGAAEFAAAERAADTAQRLDPNHRRAAYVSAFLHRARGRHAESLAAFERVIALKPDATDRLIAVAYAQAGAQWMYLGQPEKTRELADKAIAITPPHSPALGVFYWIIGRVPFVEGNYAEAIDWLERSVASRTNFWYTRAWLIAAYALSNQTEAARRALSDFQALFPELDSIAAVVDAQGTVPQSHPLLIDAWKKVHDGLKLAGLPA